MEKKEKKMIGRIAKGEKVIVEMLPEDLQEKFDSWKLLAKKAQYAQEAMQEDPTDENAKEAYIIAGKVFQAKHSFWVEVHTRYGHWKENIGVRDGYALVVIPEGNELKNMPDFIRKLLKDKLREELQGGEDE